jgi:hypothetical protein
MSIRNQTKGVKMKKVALALAVVLGFVVIQPVQAAETNTIAIIDTAMDASKNSNVVYEACFTLNTCPNGTNFQEGPGSAMVNDWKIKGIDHGFNLAQAAVSANPNIKIVFVRISDVNVYTKFSAIHNDGTSLSRALDWVSKNSSRLNIKAVSISQSRSNFAAGACPNDSAFSTAVKTLNAQEVPTFVATGNDSKKNQIGFPSCVPGVISVSALKPDLTFASYANVGPGLAMVGRGDASVKGYCGCKTMTITGTSVATPVVATLAVTRKTSGSWSEYIASLPKVQSYPYVG